GLAALRRSTTMPRDMCDSAGATFTLCTSPKIPPDSGVSFSRSLAYRIKPGRHHERTSQRTPFERSHARAPYQQISFLVDVVVHDVRTLHRPDFSKFRFGGKARQIAPGDLAKPFFLAGIEGNHKMARKAFHQCAAVKIIESFVFKRRG